MRPRAVARCCGGTRTRCTRGVLATPGGKGATALAVAEDGRVGGFLGDMVAGYKPYLWQADGAGAELPLP